MNPPEPTVETVTQAELRRQLGYWIEQVLTRQKTIRVERHGRPSAYIVSPWDWARTHPGEPDGSR